MFTALDKHHENQAKIDAAIERKELYIVDYSDFAEMTASSETKFTMFLTFPAISYFYTRHRGAMALFEIPTDKKIRQRQWISTLAIQVISRSCKPEIFYPDDSIRYKIGRAIFQSLDGDYHECVLHLGQAHLVLESLVVATYRQLPTEHPLFVLLSPHMEGTLFINNVADKTLVLPGGTFEVCTSFC